MVPAFKLGNHDLAENVFKEILQSSKDHGVSWYYLGRIYIARRKIPEAVECLKKAIETYSGYDYDWYTPKAIRDALERVSM